MGRESMGRGEGSGLAGTIRNHSYLKVPVMPLFYFGGGGREKGWKDADMRKTNSPSTPSGLCSSKEGVGSKSGCISLQALG